MAKTVLKISNLSFNYEKKYVLDDISFEVTEGEYLGIVGENGSGKSTLMNIIIGKLNPSKGRVDLYEKKIGYLSQQVRNFNKKFPATVEEIIGANLYSEMGVFKRLSKDHREKINEVLKIVNMEGYKKRLIGNLSGGQQQRVFLARLLVNNPKIILMDEPIVGLDDESIKMFYQLMDKLNSELGLTIIMVTHDSRSIENRADKLIALDKSKVKIIEKKKIVKESDAIFKKTKTN